MKDLIMKKLEEKTQVKFTGKTGKDLEDYLEKNAAFLLDNYSCVKACAYANYCDDTRDPFMMIGLDSTSPDAFYLTVKSKDVQILKDYFVYDDIISDCDVPELTLDVAAQYEEEVMISAYYAGQKFECNYFTLIDYIHDLCVRFHATAELEYMYEEDSDPDIKIKFDNDSVTPIGKIIIDDDNSDLLIRSYMRIAARCGNESIDKYLDLFEIEYNELESETPLKVKQMLASKYDDKKDIIRQLEIYPSCILKYMDNNEILYDETVIQIFVKSNNYYNVVVYNDLFDTPDAFFDKLNKNVGIYNVLHNSIVQEKQVFDFDLLSDKSLAILGESCSNKLIYFKHSSIDKVIEKLKDVPGLILPIMYHYAYYYEENKKELEKLKVKYNLREILSPAYFGCVKAIEILRENNLSYNISSLFNLYSNIYVTDYNEKEVELIMKHLAKDEIETIAKEDYSILKFCPNDIQLSQEMKDDIVKNCLIKEQILDDVTLETLDDTSSPDFFVKCSNCQHCKIYKKFK